MCGRYASFLPPDALRAVFGTVNPLGNFAPSWNVAPRQRPPVVLLNREGGRHVEGLQGGLTKEGDEFRAAMHDRNHSKAGRMARRRKVEAVQPA